MASGLTNREQSFRAIADNYKTLDEVVEALRTQGLESSNLIIAVDFTKVRIRVCILHVSLQRKLKMLPACVVTATVQQVQVQNLQAEV